MKRNRIISAVAALALALGLAGCGSIEDPRDISLIEIDPPDVLTPAKLIYEDMLISKNFKQQGDIAGKDADDKFKASQYDFAAELFKSSFTDEKSSLVSPLSVMLALSMTANGADGDTLTEMQNVLGGGMDIDDLNMYLYTYAQSLKSDGSEGGVKMSIANSIWYRYHAALNVYDDFLQKNADYYGASVFRSEFDQNTVDAINGWVLDNTDAMIDKIVDEINPDTMMYLINAIAFEAEWAEQYNEYQISEMPFTDITGNEIAAQMMSSTEKVYLDDGKAKGFMKYYKGGRYAFAALLPNDDIGIEEYVSSLTGEALAEALTPVDRSAVIYAKMPKFSFDYDIGLKDVLIDMGMPSAFNSADFSRMAEMELYIADVLHKTHIEVDESGTKAAAVTNVTMDCEAAIMTEEPIYITLDRPFVFAIVDRQTNLPVFIGATLTVE